MVILKSQPIAIDSATGLQRYGFIETRFLIYLCNHINQLKDSLHDAKLAEQLRGNITLNIKDLVTSLGLMDRDARRIFTKSHETFQKGISNNEDGLWIVSSDYSNGSITLRISDQLAQLFRDRNPYLYNFHISQISGINSISAIRFLNFLYASKANTRPLFEVTLGLEEIRAIFGVEDTYSCLSNIRSKVIGKSIEILNKNTKFKISVKRKSSSVDDFNYHFTIES